MPSKKTSVSLFPPVKVEMIDGKPWHRCWWHKQLIQSRYGIPVPVKEEKPGSKTRRRGVFTNAAAAWAWVIKQQNDDVIAFTECEKFRHIISEDLQIPTKYQGDLEPAPTRDPDDPHWRTYECKYPWLLEFKGLITAESDFQEIEGRREKAIKGAKKRKDRERLCNEKDEEAIKQFIETTTTAKEPEVTPETAPTPTPTPVVAPRNNHAHLVARLYTFPPTDPSDESSPPQPPEEAPANDSSGFTIQGNPITRVFFTQKDRHPVLVMDEGVGNHKRDSASGHNQRCSAYFDSLPPLFGTVRVLNIAKVTEPAFLTDTPKPKTSTPNLVVLEFKKSDRATLKRKILPPPTTCAAESEETRTNKLRRQDATVGFVGVL